ncbi:MAG: hypothetical protein KDA63_03255, partial [Planctomycetales bacterium]|nr:hypothetical protein [Planctomycetales bacterium]
MNSPATLTLRLRIVATMLVMAATVSSLAHAVVAAERSSSERPGIERRNIEQLTPGAQASPDDGNVWVVSCRHLSAAQAR